MSGIRGLGRRPVLQTLSILGLALASAAASAGTPHLVLDINAQTHAVDSSPTPLGKLGSALYFIASPAPGGSQSALFRTDGTGGGTSMVKSLGGFGVLTPAKGPLFLAAGTKAYFLASFTGGGRKCGLPMARRRGPRCLGTCTPEAMAVHSSWVSSARISFSRSRPHSRTGRYSAVTAPAPERARSRTFRPPATAPSSRASSRQTARSICSCRRRESVPPIYG
jgi:hypothetical protein